MIEVVASVCWFIGATTWIDVSVTDQLQKQAVREYHDCQKKGVEPVKTVTFIDSEREPRKRQRQIRRHG
jgi:hypothetical protein